MWWRPAHRAEFTIKFKMFLYLRIFLMKKRLPFLKGLFYSHLRERETSTCKRNTDRCLPHTCALTGNWICDLSVIETMLQLAEPHWPGQEEISDPDKCLTGWLIVILVLIPNFGGIITTFYDSMLNLDLGRFIRKDWVVFLVLSSFST